MATPLAALIPDAHATIHQLDAPPEEPPAPEPRDCDPVACTLPINQTERNVARRRFCSCDVGRAARRAAEVRLYGVDADLAPDVPVRLYGATLELAAELAAAEPLRAGAIAAAAAFVDRYREGSIPGAGLAIFGPVGTGKSGLVAGILRDARALGVPSLWYTYLDLLDAVRNQYGRREDGQRLNAACAVPLLAIDDLGDPYRIRGDVQETENRRHIIHTVIGRRSAQRLPTLITANYDLLSELAEQFCDRTADRIREACVIHTMPGASLRKAPRI